MKYSYNWLKEISGTKLSPEKAVEFLTMHSFEIEGMEKIEQKFPGVIVGKILEIKKHPDADKLQLAKIDAGGKILDIVCGAWNIKVGDKVPVALAGTKLPNGMEIKAAEIRGQKSSGMLCAADELGLGKDHSGIIILDKNAKVGEPVDKYLGLDDMIVEIKVLPDRAHDALSHVGVAREIAALEGRKLDYDFDGLRLQKSKSKNLKIEIKDNNLCSRYIGAVMTDIEIKESPKWLKDRLIACGVNAINNVVDATNYVMLELGQPLHAFDAEKIPGSKIVVRRANEKEKIELLDGDVKELNTSDLLITNGETPLALAGIKGGLNSGITENTKTIIIEAASFNAANIRKTRTRLNIKTESSDRFEKDIDPNLTEKAAAHVIEILEHIANGKLEEIVDVYPKLVKPWKMKLDLDYVNSLLGETIPASRILKILSDLDIYVPSIRPRMENKMKSVICTIPTYRVDLKTQEDLIEEIGRIWGYEKIRPKPMIESIVPPVINEQIFFEQEIKDILAGIGFSEVYNYSFYSQKDASLCGLSNLKHLELANPQNPDQQLVRASLVPNILKNIRENLKYFSNFKIFEAGRVYWPKGDFPEEKRMLLLAQVLERDSKIFYELKGVAEAMIARLNIKDVAFKPAEKMASAWHPTRTAEIKYNNEVMGIIGEINPLVLSQYKIKKRLALAEIDLEILRKHASSEKTYKSLPKFPIVTRDISLLDKNKLTVAEISAFIKKAGGNLVLSVELFDTFQKEGIMSHAFHIHLGADRTLSGQEVDKVVQKIISGLEKELRMEIRK